MIINEYFKAFASKDVHSLKSLLHGDVVLQAPGDGIVRGREAVLRNIQGIFDNFDVDIELNRWFKGENGSAAVEFHLVLVDKSNKKIVIDGIDLIELKDNKIVSLRAYLDTTVGP
ncbi:MAG: hypothetical protein HW380_2653 [Magnetococcales bacterium]|nr:hypothetical protein [Magnetococcales bacterium]